MSPLPSKLQAAPALSQPVPPTPESPPLNDPETTRKIRRTHCQAEHVVDSMSMGKIGSSDYFGEIQDDYWKKVNENPLDYLDNDDKLREMIKQIARTYKVRIY